MFWYSEASWRDLRKSSSNAAIFAHKDVASS